MANKRFTIPVNDLNLPEEDHISFQDFNRAPDTERWRGRLSLLELPEGGDGGAGGNADDSGDPIDTYHEGRDKGKITGPASPFEQGNSK